MNTIICYWNSSEFEIIWYVKPQLRCQCGASTIVLPSLMDHPCMLIIERVGPPMDAACWESWTTHGCCLLKELNHPWMPAVERVEQLMYAACWEGSTTHVVEWLMGAACWDSWMTHGWCLLRELNNPCMLPVERVQPLMELNHSWVLPVERVEPPMDAACWESWTTHGCCLLRQLMRRHWVDEKKTSNQKVPPEYLFPLLTFINFW